MATTNYFLNDGSDYALRRPDYPDELLDVLAANAIQHRHALDVGCGTGQLATLLARRFVQVTATDPSQSQIEHATRCENVSYRCEPAETSSLPDNSVDLVTAAQAAHWFNLDRFYDEVRRVARNKAMVALLTYGVPRMSGVIGERLSDFYWHDIHGYWPAERRHVEDSYQSLVFPFDELDIPAIGITCRWSRHELTGYIATWSSVKTAAQAGEQHLFEQLQNDLAALWPDAHSRHTVYWPIAGRMGAIG